MKLPLLAVLILLSSAAQADMGIDSATRNRVVTNLANKIESTYVSPERGAALKAQLLQHLREGRYDQYDKAEAFAEALSEEMQAVDKHFALRFMDEALEPDRAPNEVFNPATISAKKAATLYERRVTEGKADNFGFHDNQRLPGNIAYLRISNFYEPILAEKTIQYEMGRAADASAFIIDVRDNGGGNAEAVALTASYLFDDQPVHLGDRYIREANRTESLWTLPPASDLRFGGTKPVFVLVNKETFSAAEAFAFFLQKLKRATVIGETTRGGSHRTRGYTVDEHFLAGIPHAMTTSAVTHEDWEGKGVQPDHQTTGVQALVTAMALAQKANYSARGGK